MALLNRGWSYALAVILVLGTLYGAYRHGVTVTDDKWARADAARQLRQAKGLAVDTAKSRSTEQDWQQKSNQVGKDARAQNAAAAADGVAADAAADGMRDAASKLAASVGNVSCDPGVTPRGASATRAAMVLSDMLQRADKRAGDLARRADEAVIAGLACEAAYDSLNHSDSGSRRAVFQK